MQHLRKAFLKHGYLFIAAAWLYTISFIVSNYLSYNASPKRTQSKLEALVNKGLQDMDVVCKDTALISSCLDEKPSPMHNWRWQINPMVFCVCF